MFKKFITMMMVAAIFTVQAHASTENGLKKAFEEMNFALTVEWDQKDKGFYETQMKKFMGVVADLQKQGMTNAQMIDFAKSQMKDAQAAKNLETAFSMISINKMNAEEASKYMLDSMKRTQSVGASWNGDVLLYLAVGLLIVALAVGVAGGTVVVDNGNSCYYYDDICNTGYPWYDDYVCTCNSCDYYCY